MPLVAPRPREKIAQAQIGTAVGTALAPRGPHTLGSSAMILYQVTKERMYSYCGMNHHQQLEHDG
jgi:hypothetical protein